MADWIDLVSTDGIEDGSMRRADADGHEFLVARVGEEYLVSDNRCPHLHGNLSKGTLDGTVVECPLHHSRFDLRDGSVVQWTNWTGAVLSVGELVRHPRPLRVYDSKVDGDRLFVGAQKTPPSMDTDS